MPEEQHEKKELLSALSLNKIQDEDEDDSFLSNLDFIKFLIVARRNLIWVLLIFSLAVTVAYFYLRYIPPMYQSSSILKLEIKSNAGLLGLSSGAQNSQRVSDLNGEIELIRSSLVLSQVVDLIDAEVSYFAKGSILDEEKFRSSPFNVSFDVFNPGIYNMRFYIDFISQSEFQLKYQSGGSQLTNRYRFGVPFETPDFRMTINLNPGVMTEKGHLNYYFILNSKEALYNSISAGLNVEIVNPDANTIKISFKDQSPLKARDIVAAVDSIYLIEGLANKFRSSEQTILFLSKNLTNTEQDLERYERNIQNFFLKNKTVDVRGEFSSSITKLQLIDGQITEERKKLSLLEELSDQLLNGQSFKESEPSMLFFSDPQLTDLCNRWNNIVQQRDMIRISNKENTLAVRTKERELTTVKNSLIQIINQNKGTVYDKVATLIAEHKKLQDSFFQFPTKDSEFKRLQRFYNLHEKYYMMMMDKKVEYEIAKAATVPEFRVLFKPSIARVPIYPNPVNSYSYAALAALLISFFFVAFKYFTHNTIDNIGELEKSTLASVIGFIPRYNNGKMLHSRLVIDENPKGSVSEALRSIRTNLEFLSTTKGPKIYSVTSTVSGEGKTFVTINLAGVLAYSGQKVIILDLDMRKPKVHQGFGGQNEKGLSTILIGRHTWKECVNATQIDTLDYISSGPIPPNPSELILSQAYDDLIADLKKIYDVIVIDTPPVGLVTDGIIIMKKVDVPIYVVRAEYSKKGYEKNINRLLIKNKFTKLTCLLNDFDNLKGYGYGYQYGYGYGYGYYTNETKTKGNLFSLFKKKES